MMCCPEWPEEAESLDLPWWAQLLRQVKVDCSPGIALDGCNHKKVLNSHCLKQTERQFSVCSCLRHCSVGWLFPWPADQPDPLLSTTLMIAHAPCQSVAIRQKLTALETMLLQTAVLGAAQASNRSSCVPVTSLIKGVKVLQDWTELH